MAKNRLGLGIGDGLIEHNSMMIGERIRQICPVAMLFATENYR
ncbi:MAG TPA: hypothetical protein V6D28_01400 [Leptolyngbyaceae cyanobacterium]